MRELQIEMFPDHDIVAVANQNSDKLSAEFLAWLPENLYVWEAFLKETRLVLNVGFRHYSSYTIVEFLRHHSSIREKGSQYKINNNIRPYLSRLFAIAYPQHADLFEFRTTTKTKGNSE